MNANMILTTLLLAAAAAVPVLAADDTPQTVIQVDFGVTGADAILAPGMVGVLTTAPDEMVGGKRSLKGDSRASTQEWNEFFHSKMGLFKAHEAYTLSFDYRVLARADNASFYTLFRRQGANGGNDGWKEWMGKPGDTGHIETGFPTRGSADYFVIIGIHNKGAIAINNLVIRTDPASVPVEIGLPELHRTWKSPGHTSYYVDSQDGNDQNDGKSPQKAWRTLTKVNDGEFGPGDRVLLHAGSHWTGILSPGGSGADGAPAILTRYGDGPKPAIDAGGQFLAALYLSNVEQWEVSDLDIANKGPKRVARLAGVLVRLQDFGEAHHIQLKDLDVHDVFGSLVKADGGGNGIYCVNGGRKVKSRFNGLLIEGCHLQRTDRNAITMDGNWARDTWYPNLGVIIRNNRLDDFGGDGIVPIACDGALVEHNTLKLGRQRCDDYAAGIWPWSCDNTVVQFNEVSGMKGTKDGEGYDSDYNCHNTLIQYNYSHDNDGGFLLICDDGGQHMPWNAGNTGTVVRYNISQNDGERLFHISGPCTTVHIYNNTFYVGPGKTTHAVMGTSWGGWTEDVTFNNNVFLVAGKASFDLGSIKKTVFENNAFYGSIQGRPDDPHAVLADPMLSAPGTGGDGLTTLAGYQLKPGSPCRGAGVPIPNNGGRDFWDHPLPPGVPTNIGADGSR